MTEQKQIRSAMRIKKTYKPTGSSSGSLTKNNKKTKVANNQNNKKEGDDDGDTDAKVEVKNVLYGMNQGFIGVNFSAEVKIPATPIPCRTSKERWRSTQ